MRFNYLSYYFLFIFNALFALNPQIKEEFPNSIYIDPEQYYSVDSLLNFEDIGYNIEDPIEKSKYYFIVAHLLNLKLIALNVKIDNINEKISDLINSYEEKLLKEHYLISYDIPTFDYEYQYVKFSDKAVIKKVFYKQANVLKNQYIKIYNASIRKIELLSDYLLALREEYIISKTTLVHFQYEENFENKFYLTLQDMLSNNLIQKSKLISLKTITNANGNIVSTIQIENIQGEDIIFSKDFEYFEDNLLAAIRERENGIIVKETLYGNNKYSQNFYDFIFDSSFYTLNYDNFTEVYYKLNNKINLIDFFTFNGIKIGSIEYEYDIHGRLINEKWYKGERVIIREFNCFYKPGEGNYRVIEKNRYGEIVFQDVINSKDMHIKIEGK